MFQVVKLRKVYKMYKNKYIKNIKTLSKASYFIIIYLKKTELILF